MEVEEKKYVDTFKELLEQEHLLESFGRGLLDVALRTTPPEVKGWYAEGMERFDNTFPSRIVNNLSAVYAGLKLTEKLCGMYKLT